MSLLQRHRWFVAAAGITLAFAGVSGSAHKSFGLTGFADLLGFALLLAASGVAIANGWQRPGQERSFWAPMALGFSLWAINQSSWCYYEIVLRRQIPDPYFFDVVLFFHSVPMISAVAWRPDLRKREGRVHLSLLSFLMLLGWWIFLYAFVVFPYQYVVLNVAVYNRYYDLLFGVQNCLLVVVLGLATWSSSGDWRRLYVSLLVAQTGYAIGSQLLNRAIVAGTYYSGSFYDMLFIAPLAWMAAALLSARRWQLNISEFNLNRRWKKLVPQLAMVAILSLPVLGAWTAFSDTSSPLIRGFRIEAVLIAMLVLGALVFLRQYFQDQALMSLLTESRQAYDGQKQLQSQLVQREKLASLGTLIAGAAREINHPLDAILSYSEQLWAKERLCAEQDTLVRKIVQQAQRTSHLVSGLLSFAQQAPGQKTPVDIGVLLGRAVQMLENRRPSGKIQVRLSLEPEFPRINANANQIFQVFLELIENAMDALEEVGGGALEITACRSDAEAILRFSDDGPGLRDPRRVFDPFYTTKPIGKGTGLGLSAVYGMIQDHGGSITCENKPQGGALFQIRLPIPAEPAVQVAGAAG